MRQRAFFPTLVLALTLLWAFGPTFIITCAAGVPLSTTNTEWGTATTTSSECPIWEEQPGGDDKEEDDSSSFVDVAIIGAGPAGLATAIGLLRRLDDNVKIRIYERATELRSSSQGMLSLFPNGMTSLGKIHTDLPRLVTNAGCPFETKILVTIDKDGGITERIDQPSKPEPGTILIRWHALQMVLAGLVPDGILTTGHSLGTFKETSDYVLLRFDNGKTVRAGIVIGADGTFSSVRRRMFPTDRPVYFGQMNWNAIIQTSSLPLDSRPPAKGIKIVNYDGEPARWSAYINDCGGGHTFFQLRVADVEKARALSGSNGRGGLGLAGTKAALLPVVKRSADVTNILHAVPEETMFERVIVGRLPALTWCSPGGRVALLGDAAHGMHPSMGQGCNSALGSAVALTESLAAQFHTRGDDRDSNWAVKGLAEYESIRLPRMDWLHRIANMLGCGQASGEEWLDRETMRSWFTWPQHADSSIPPPTEGRDTVKAFNPLSCPGVSIL